MLLLSPPPGVGLPRGALWCVLGWRAVLIRQGTPLASKQEAWNRKITTKGTSGGFYNLEQAVDWVELGRLERMQAT